MNLTKIGKGRVATVTRDSSLEDAARMMREFHVGDVVVVERRGEKETPVGILTDRDIVMATIALGAAASALQVQDIMTSPLVTANAKDSLDHVIQLMRDHGVKRIPIVGHEEELVAIVSLQDLVSLLSAQLSALAEVSDRQRKMELQRRRHTA